MAPKKYTLFAKGNPVIVEVNLAATPDAVWKAITDPGQMKQWYFNELEDFSPVVGFSTRVTVHFEDKVYLHEWKVTEVVPGNKLSYGWRYPDEPGDSLVTFELFPENEQVRLKLTHAGIESFPQEKPDFRRDSFTEGWTELLGKNLKEFLEKH